MTPQSCWVVAVFGTVYLGRVLGGLLRLHQDRTGVALLGAIAWVGAGVLTPAQAAVSVHLPTILLLFSFTVISAQMRLGGFYAAVTRRITALPLAPMLARACLARGLRLEIPEMQRPPSSLCSPPPIGVRHLLGSAQRGAT